MTVIFTLSKEALFSEQVVKTDRTAYSICNSQNHSAVALATLESTNDSTENEWN